MKRNVAHHRNLDKGLLSDVFKKETFVHEFLWAFAEIVKYQGAAFVTLLQLKVGCLHPVACTRSVVE
jgi:hypothetical protein